MDQIYRIEAQGHLFPKKCGLDLTSEEMMIPQHTIQLFMRRANDCADAHKVSISDKETSELINWAVAAHANWKFLQNVLSGKIGVGWRQGHGMIYPPPKPPEADDAQ